MIHSCENSLVEEHKQLTLSHAFTIHWYTHVHAATMHQAQLKNRDIDATAEPISVQACQGHTTVRVWLQSLMTTHAACVDSLTLVMTITQNARQHTSSNS